MFLISKGRIYLLFLCAVLAFLALGINSYFNFSRIGPGETLSLKFFAENFIYYTILIVLLLTIIFITIITKSKNICKELDKIIELSRQGKYSGGAQLKKLGILGGKIIDINSQLNLLNEMKSLKISSLSSTINFLLEKSKQSVLLLDAQGMVTKISRYLIEQSGMPEKDLINKYAEDIFEKFKYSNLIVELRKSKFSILESPMILDSMEEPINVNLVVYPIFNYKNEISNCICTLVSDEEVEQLEQPTALPEILPQPKETEKKKNLHEPQFFKRFTDIFR